MSLPPLPPARRPTLRAALRLARSAPRHDPAIAPAFYGDVGDFLLRRRMLQAEFEDAYDRRDASRFFWEKAERLAGVLLGEDS